MRLPRTAKVIATLTVSWLAVTLTVPASFADEKSDAESRKSQVDANISQLQEDLSGTSAELTAAYARLAEAQSQLPAAQAALTAAKAAEAEADRKDAEMAGRLAAAEQAQTQAQAELDSSRTEIATTQAAMGRLAASQYMSGTVSSELSLVMESSSPSDFADRYVLADSVMRSRAGTLGDLNETIALQVNARARLDAVQAEVADLREQARVALLAAQAARRVAADRKAAVDKLVADAAAASASIQARKDEEQAQLNELTAEQSKLEAQLAEIAARQRAQAGGGGSWRGGGGVLGRPTDGYITSGFGYRIHPIYHYRRLHAGTDFGSPCGTPIHAAEAGTIISAGWAGGYGNRIVIDHGLVEGVPLATSYSHMSGYAVRSGHVDRGEVIGYVGTTGSSTGCHLHFEVFEDGEHVDPMRWL